MWLRPRPSQLWSCPCDSPTKTYSPVKFSNKQMKSALNKEGLWYIQHSTWSPGCLFWWPVVGQGEGQKTRDKQIHDACNYTFTRPRLDSKTGPYKWVPIDNPPKAPVHCYLWWMYCFVYICLFCCVDFFCWLFKLPLMGMIKFSKTLRLIYILGESVGSEVGRSSALLFMMEMRLERRRRVVIKANRPKSRSVSLQRTGTLV